MALTVAIVSMGAMGAPLAQKLTQSGLVVLSDLAGRSESSISRAKDAGVIAVSLEEAVTSCDLFVSVLPPSQAVTLAKMVSRFQIKGKVFADLNAVSPKTSQEIESIVKEASWSYAEGGIIGTPPQGDYNPAIYISGQDRQALAKLESLKHHGWNLKVLENGGVGASKALKNSYAAITKGLTGLASGSILAANAHSPATAEALVHEMNNSIPGILKFLSRTLPQVESKAYRFGGEMLEIASYVDEQLGRSQGEPWRGLSHRYDDAAKPEVASDQAKQLKAFAIKASELSS